LFKRLESNVRRVKNISLLWGLYGEERRGANLFSAGVRTFVESVGRGGRRTIESKMGLLSMRILDIRNPQSVGKKSQKLLNVSEKQ
jgi:hypothetical protein